MHTCGKGIHKDDFVGERLEMGKNDNEEPPLKRARNEHLNNQAVIDNPSVMSTQRLSASTDAEKPVRLFLVSQLFLLLFAEDLQLPFDARVDNSTYFSCVVGRSEKAGIASGRQCA